MSSLRRLLLAQTQTPSYIDKSYLRSDGSSWFDTGIAVDGDTEIELVYQVVSSAGGTTNTLFGSRNAYLNMDYGFRAVGIITYGNTTSSDTIKSQTTKNIFSSIISGSNRTISVKRFSDSVSLKIYNTPKQTFSNGLNLYCFATNNNGIPSLISTATDMINFKIKKNGILVGDFVGCVNGGVPCARNKVDNSFHYNMGSGSFTTD